jgi:hypothetical protein
MKLLHSRSKIFFPNPHVVRVDYSGRPDAVVDAEYRKLTRTAYKLLQGTWGWSPLGHEHIQVKNDHGHLYPPGPRHFDGMSQTKMLDSLFNPDWQIVRRGYVCFKDELDLLQFRLTIDTKSIRVVMWPENTEFTIHEVVEPDES